MKFRRINKVGKFEVKKVNSKRAVSKMSFVSRSLHAPLKNKDVEEREKERERGSNPTAAAPSQPDCPGVSRSDHSAGSKESAS